MCSVECTPIRLALSARLDGEPTDLDQHELDAHLRSCAGCRGWLEAAEALTLRARTEREPDRAPDLVAAVLAADVSPPPTIDWRRAALALVALAQLTLAIGSILGGDRDHAHQFHELGAWDAALAAGFLVAAWRPARAWGMLPLVAAVVVALALATLADMGAGHATFGRELPHLLAVAGLVLLRPLALGARPPLRLVRPA
jgi:predicted anti-sigma-YlaC factor YlaD